jgi:Na+/proline symporter
LGKRTCELTIFAEIENENIFISIFGAQLGPALFGQLFWRSANMCVCAPAKHYCLSLTKRQSGSPAITSII